MIKGLSLSRGLSDRDKLFTSLVFFFVARTLSSLYRIQGVYPEVLNAVADRISSEYVHLGLELGITFNRIKQIRMSHRTNVLEIVRQILHEWCSMNQPEQNAQKEATVGWLATALLNTGCDVEALKEFEDRPIIVSKHVSVPADSGWKCHIQ